MSKTSRNRRRDLVVDGRTWRWQVTSAAVFIWEPAPSTRRHMLVREWCDDPDLGGAYPIGPGQVVAWIRENLLPAQTATKAPVQPRRPKTAAVPRRPVAAPAPQPAAYLVVPVANDRTRCSSCEGVPVEIHLDPQVALDRARILSADAPERLRIAREMEGAVQQVRRRMWQGKGPRDAGADACRCRTGWKRGPAAQCRRRPCAQALDRGLSGDGRDLRGPGEAALRFGLGLVPE